MTEERRHADVLIEPEPYVTDDVPLDDVRSNRMRPLVYVLLLLIGGLIATGFVAKVPEYRKARFVLKGESREIGYQFSRPVFVEAVMVRAGQAVTAGQPLARITSPEIVALIARLRESEKALVRQRTEARKLAKNRSREQELKIQKLASQLEETRKLLETEQESYAQREQALAYDVAEAERKLNRNLALKEQGFVSEAELADLKKAVHAARERQVLARQQHESELARLNGRIRQFEIDRQMARLEIQRIETEQADAVQQAEKQVADIRTELTHLYRKVEIADGTLVLQAPADGRVSYLYAGDRTLPAGETLLRLTTGAGRLFAVAALDAGQMGRLEEGQGAVLKVDAFPHYRYGVVRGVVRSVSISPDEKGNLPFTVGIVDAGDLAPHLRPGMTGTVSVMVGQRRFFAMLFGRMVE